MKVTFAATKFGTGGGRANSRWQPGAASTSGEASDFDLNGAMLC